MDTLSLRWRGLSLRCRGTLVLVRLRPLCFLIFLSSKGGLPSNTTPEPLFSSLFFLLEVSFPLTSTFLVRSLSPLFLSALCPRQTYYSTLWR